MPVYAPTYRMVVNVPYTRPTRDPGMFLGADPAAAPAAPSVSSAILQALQVATPIVQQHYAPNQTIPSAITNYLPVVNPNVQPVKRTWVPWALGGGGVVVLGVVLLFALRSRK